MAADDKRKGRWIDDAATMIAPGRGAPAAPGGRGASPPPPVPSRPSRAPAGTLEVIDMAEEEYVDAEPEEPAPRPRRPTQQSYSQAPGGQRPRMDQSQAGGVPRSRALTTRGRAATDDGDDDDDYRRAPVPTAQPRERSGRPQSSNLPAVQMPTPFRAHEVANMCPDESLFMVHSPDSEQSAQYRLLKFRLKEAGDPRVLALTSAGYGEGQHIAAANLALALAEGRRTRVIIVEANLRKPGLPRLFGLDDGTGLSEQLRRRRRDPDGPWDVLELANGFHLLHAGKPAENPAAMLNSEEFARLMGDLRMHYDFVVVDTPPMLDNTDMTIVQDLMDGVILVCRSGTSDRGEVRKALQRLSPHNVLGLLLT